MREIKFRGICDEEETTHYGKWIHGYLGYEDCINPIEIVGDKDGDIEDYGIYDELTFIKVRKNTIGQFTGLHDKNGVEIYEGDILYYNREIKIKGIVKWIDDEALFTIHYESGKYGLFAEEDLSYFEAIGNIHEEKVE